jgi:molybdopterin converting factor small subunit
MIHVKLTGEFAKLAPEGNDKGSFDIEYEDGVTLSRLVTRFGVKERGIKYSVMVNNSRKPEDYVLNDSDSVLIIPLLAGG